MALTISNASIGFDENNVTTALGNLNTEVIGKTKSEMRQQLSKLRDSVDASWVGQSADIFKQNMESDVNNICDALDKTYETLKSEFYQIVNEMAEADRNIIKRRGE